LTKRKERINFNQNIPLKSALLLLLGSVLFFTSRGQFYLRGEIKDENNGLLPDVSIRCIPAATYIIPAVQGLLGYLYLNHGIR
jgi:hypothetical protein